MNATPEIRPDPILPDPIPSGPADEWDRDDKRWNGSITG
jgi:hypothetical protein